MHSNGFKPRICFQLLSFLGGADVHFGRRGIAAGASVSVSRTKRWARRKANRTFAVVDGPTPGTCWRSVKDACARLESPPNFPFHHAAAGLLANDANNSPFDEPSNDGTTRSSSTSSGLQAQPHHVLALTPFALETAGFLSGRRGRNRGEMSTIRTDPIASAWIRSRIPSHRGCQGTIRWIPGPLLGDQPESLPGPWISAVHG